MLQNITHYQTMYQRIEKLVEMYTNLYNYSCVDLEYDFNVGGRHEDSTTIPSSIYNRTLKSKVKDLSLIHI